MSNDIPLAVHGNLVWRSNGTVTAMFVAPTNGDRHGEPARRTGAVTDWSRTYSTFDTPWAHVTLDTEQVPDDIVARMLAAVPKGRECPPEWARHIETQLGALATKYVPEHGAPFIRFSFLWVDMPTTLTGRGASVFARAASALFGTPPEPPSEADVARAVAWSGEQWRRMHATNSGIVPVPPSVVSWFYAHARTLGAADPDYTDPFFQEGGHAGVPTLVPFPEAPDTSVRGLLRVPGPDGDCFQRTLVLNALPRMWLYPDDCLRDRLDSLPFPVKSTLLGQTPMRNEELKHGLNRAATANQATTIDTSSSNRTHHALNESESDRTYLDAVANAEGRAYPTTVLLTIGAASVDELDQRTADLTDMLTGHKKRATARPMVPPNQEAIYSGLLPGGVRDPLVSAYARSGLTAQDVASLGQHHGWDFGDGQGRLYGFRADSRLLRLVFRDISMDAGKRANTTMHVGSPGFGKTNEAMQDADACNKLGLNNFLWDHSPEGETIRVVKGFSGSKRVVSANGNVIIDPLRLLLARGRDLTPKDFDLARQVTRGFLTGDLGIIGMGEDHDTIVSAMTTLLDCPHGVWEVSTPNVMRVLWVRGGDQQFAGRCRCVAEYPEGSPQRMANARLGERMRTNSRMGGFRRGVYAEEGVLLDLNVKTIAFHSDNDQTTAAQAASTGANLSAEAVEAEAEAYLVGSLALAYLLEHPDVFTLLTFPEVANLSKSPRTRELLERLMRKARRGNGALSMDSQLSSDLDDMPEDVLALIRHRTVAGLDDPEAARSAIAWAGGTADDSAVFALTHIIPPAIARTSTSPKLVRSGPGNTAWMMVTEHPDTVTALRMRTDDDALAELEAYFTEHPEADDALELEMVGVA